MASNISHEINNPLAIINGTTELMKFRINQLESQNGTNEQYDQMKIYCDTMLKTTKKVGKIISGLRRLSNHGETIEKNDENLNVLIEESFSFGLETLKKSRINLFFEASSPEITAHVMGVELSQVIVNLITNAKQALEKLDNTFPKKIHIKLEELEDSIKIVITNSGPKIPKEIEHKIFDSFFTTKKAGEGSGIGLHISQKIMEQMNGKIYLNTDWESPQFVLEFPKK
jgi:signal transduction histidine kinase